MSEERIKISDKYEIVIDWPISKFEALRHGESWRNLVGDNFILAMAQEIQELRGHIKNADEALTEIRDCLDDFYNHDTPRRQHTELQRFAGQITVMDKITSSYLSSRS